MKIKIEFQFVNKCPKVSEMQTNIKNAINDLDYEIEYYEKILDGEITNDEGYGCPTLLVNDRDLMGKVKCEINGPLCRVYPKGIPTAEEIKKIIIYSY